MEKDTTATACTCTAAEFLFASELGRTGNDILDFLSDELDAELLPGETVTATIAPTSGNAAEARVAVYLVEQF